MFKIIAREPEQQMVNGKIMKMKKLMNQKPVQKKYFAAAGGGGKDPDPFNNNRFNEFVKNLKKKHIPDDIAKKFNNICNNKKFQNIYKAINRIIKK